MAIPEQFVDELVSRTDIVDLVSESVRLTKKETPTGAFAHSTVRKRRTFPCLRTSRSAIVLAVIRAVEPSTS